ncbi:MAG: nucleotide exchange factor GrpE [Myxococcales bacterium]
MVNTDDQPADAPVEQTPDGREAGQEAGKPADPPEAQGPGLEELLERGEVPGPAVAALEAERQRASEAEDRMLRAMADLENQRKRLERDFEDRVRFANERVLKEMLQVFDSLELGLAHTASGAEVGELRKGIEAALEQFRTAFENSGATRIEAAPGMRFDPKVHEAVFQDDAADQPAQTIVNVVQTGFTFHERVLRPARVVVATGKGKKS